MTNSSALRKSNSSWNASAYRNDLATDPVAADVPGGTCRSHSTCSSGSVVLFRSRLSCSSFTRFNGLPEDIQNDGFFFF